MAYVVTGGVFLGADYIWLNRAMSFYRSSLGGLLRRSRTSPRQRLSTGMADGFLAPVLGGLVAFVTYDLTNLATQNRGPLLFTFVDMVWGKFVTALAASAGFSAIRTLPPGE